MAKKVCDKEWELPERDSLSSETCYQVLAACVSNTIRLQDCPGKTVNKGSTDTVLHP